jgi:hypothetical protein
LNGAGSQTDIVASLTSGGYYAVEPADMNLMIIGLNTIAISALVTPDSTVIADQFAWFEAKLAAASKAGKKVWLLMHAPPGADESTTGSSVNSQGKITAATMMWVDADQTKFMGIVDKYPGVITLSLAGHTHMDEFRILSAGNTLEITAGISPCFGNNPAYKIFTLDSKSLAPTDYAAVNCNLLAKSFQFGSYYTFSQAYNLDGTLAASLTALLPTLNTSGTAQTQYRSAFYSGNNAANTITNANWPVYWCGIEYMDQQKFLNAVNAS